MNRQYGRARFRTIFVEDRKGGSASLLLHRESEGLVTVAAEMIYWDAAGQFYVETFGEIPLAIMEALIAEAKETIKTE